ncbi:beta-N-acetylhexosaminidase [Virgibacillus necropolis]|uniref:beta-N-acetylhexosaminidase n=1 Tax=Virgibacillus necropolis TaxID=163877 RepID=UPI00384CA746
MLKKVGFLLISLAGVLVISWFLGDEKNQDKDSSDKAQFPEIEEKPPSNPDDEHSSTDTLINDIFTLAKKGKVLHTSIIAGKTKIQDVYKKWGDPEKSTKTPNGYYETYSAYNVTVGYQGDLIFDVRSYHSELQKIHLNQIKAAHGVPDDVRYYKDKTHDQIILVYHVNENYQLKWILPKGEENPEVHHVSVFTQVSNQNKNEKSFSKVIEKMSLDEKIGQMIIAGISGTTINSTTKSLVNKHKVGGFIFYANNLTSPKQTKNLLNQIKTENEENLLPLFMSIDQEGGAVSRLPGDLINFPANKEIGTVNNATYSYEIGKLLGKEVNEFGFNVDFAPVLDVNSNPNNPIIGNRSFGNNPEIVSKLGIQTMKGIQSQGIISVIKHFPGHGDTSVDSHLKLPKVNKSLEELNNLELIPFKNAISNGADVVMVAHILLPKLDPTNPSSMSKKIITGILRKQLNFTGVVITDDMTMDAITNNFNIGDAAVKSVKAGSDIILVAHDYDKITSTIDALKSAVKQGEISEGRINESVRRIIELKQKYDLKNKKVENINVNELNQSIKKVLNKYE